MELRDIDQTDLAEAIGVTQGAISKIAVGRTANSRLIPKIAGHLGVPLGWLLGQADSLDPESENLLSFDEREWIELLRGLTPTDRSAVLTLTRSLATSAQTPTLQAPARGFQPATTAPTRLVAQPAG